jgi:hypothetical protein
MPLSTVRPSNGQQAVKIVRGQYLARASTHYPPWRRAEDAVEWLKGEVAISPPTAKSAATLFRVNSVQMKAARERLEQMKRGKRHHANGNGSTTTLSDDAVERIVAEVGFERIWRAYEKLTQPELPLAAAE